MARLSMLIDLTRCIGCDACTVSCKQENGTPADVFFARVLNVESGTYPDVKRTYIPVLCNHCENPACLKACPNKAIYRRDDGIVLIDQDRCKGTGACVSACPYGNIVLKPEDQWYLPEDRAYERDYVKPRLNQGVARKCTLCAHRVDDGLEPACVVACPTTARIFGDLEDPDSKISTYIEAQKEETERDPFKLLPEAGTEPSTMYLGTMAKQASSTLASAPAESSSSANPNGGLPRTEVAAHSPVETVPVMAPAEPAAPNPLARVAQRLGKATGLLALATAMSLTSSLNAPDAVAGEVGAKGAITAVKAKVTTAARQHRSTPVPGTAAQDDAVEMWSNSSCSSCHGPHAMGGLGPPLAETKLSLKEFEQIVRQGKGMMPPISEKEVPAAEVRSLHNFVRNTALDESQIPIAFKVGALLSTQNVGRIFAVVGILSLLLSLRVLLYWLNCSGWRQLRPAIRRFGYARAAWVVLRSLIVDGLLVSSLWQKNKGRWAMHGLMLYGFLALGTADILMSVFNPTRGALPITHPLKLLPNIGGLAVLAGIVYVRQRYRQDIYIDNGLTIGRDYLFINLLALTIVSGFIVQWLGYVQESQWIQPFYMLHLAVVVTLLLAAPFTRFAHVFVVPSMVAMTRLTAALAASGVDMGFQREPCPGRHHKSERLALDVMKTIDPQFDGEIRLRYYP